MKRMLQNKRIENHRESKSKYSIETKSCGIVTLRNCNGPVLAEVIKYVANQQSQQPQPQTVTGRGPIVTEVDEDDGVLDFLGGQNPNTGPPTVRIGQLTIKPPRSPRRNDDMKENLEMETVAIEKLL